MKKFLNWLKNNWLFLLVVIIGGLLRFYRLQDLATFGGDQGVDYQNVARMIAERKLSLLGPITHVGIFLGPLYYYLLIPFFLIFNFDPIAAPVMFALFGTATVGLVYILAIKFFSFIHHPSSRRAESLGGAIIHHYQEFAFLTALFYAVSPVILESSRAPSQPHLIPFFATLLLISIFRIVEKTDKWWDWVGLGIASGSLIQLHFLTFPIYIFFLIILSLVVAAKRIQISLFPVSCFLFSVLLLFPWLLFELRHNFFITNQVIAYLRSGEVSFSPANYFERVLDLIWFSFDRLIGQGNQAITIIAIILSLTGIISNKVTPCRTLRCNLLSPTGIIVFYFLINILGIALYKFPLSNHYISALYTVIILFFSLGIVKILPKSLSFIVFIMFITFISSQNNLDSNHGYTMPEWVNASLIEKAANIISSDIKNRPGTYNVVNTLDGDTRANPYRYVLTYRNKVPPLGVEKYSEADYLYIVSRGARNELLEDKRWELLSFPVGNIESLGTIGGDIKLYRWDNGRADRKDLMK
ncbi:hypothetical protein HZB78_05300 [Candidatus Collierbacteria bacterium]|nr:hypothetical protein [Candidatus Collierbacteria bacterium]